MSQYENQQKRISFLSLHRDLMGNLKPQLEIDGKKHEELCTYVFTLVESLFSKYPMGENGKGGVIKNNSDEIPL